jgi:4-amino-4-deoxy-L-arabinose transferase-like glycosyltransferase
MQHMELSKIYPQKWVQVLLLIGFCVVLYFVNLGQWDLWSPDEPRYAQVAKEMVAGGDWILMHYNGKIYPDKPPLFFWLIALSSYLWQGFSSFSVRFVPALFGTLTVLITFFIGKTLFSSRAGFLSGLVLATSFEFAYLSTRANIDTMLTFFTTGSLLCFFYWYLNRPFHLGYESMRTSPRGGFLSSLPRNLSIYGFYVGMAFATLAKGPVGFLLPLLVALFYLSVQKDWKAIKRMKLLPGLLLFVGIVLCWYLPALMRGGEEYLHLTLLRHTISRYSEGWSKARPFYYYLYNFPIGFLPWILFLPAAIVYGYSREMIEKRREFFFILLWFALIFIFFSSSKGKRSLYLLPLYPAAALLVGKLWDDFISTPMDHFRNEWISFPLYGFMGLALLAGASLPVVVSMRLPSYLLYSLPAAFLLVAGSIAIFFLYRMKNHGALLCLILAVIAAGFFYTSRVVFPLVNPYKSSRFISQEITSRILPGEKLSVYGRVSAAPYNFYTGIVPIEELNTREELLHFLNSSGRVFCLLPFKDFSRFQTKEGWPEVRLITRRQVGSIDIVLISNDSSGR